LARLVSLGCNDLDGRSRNFAAVAFATRHGRRRRTGRPANLIAVVQQRFRIPVVDNQFLDPPTYSRGAWKPGQVVGVGLFLVSGRIVKRYPLSLIARSHHLTREHYPMGNSQQPWLPTGEFARISFRPHFIRCRFGARLVSSSLLRQKRDRRVPSTFRDGKFTTSAVAMASAFRFIAAAIFAPTASLAVRSVVPSATLRSPCGVQ
jgi:hypothetical protein